MTLKSWRKEFMPKMPTKRLTKLQAIEHSLRKWKGLTKANLNKHGLIRYSFWLEDSDMESFNINVESCALCVKFYGGDWFEDEKRCVKCPLYATLGNKPCDSLMKLPYPVWKNTGNPNPMIRALEKTLEREMENL